MDNGHPRQVVHIKKYPNRRYYDATRSCHVTLQEVHSLIVGGTDVVITDSRNDEDITNLVLTQIMLEHDEPKLSFFPSAMLHLMIRSNRNALRQWSQRFFDPFMGMFNLSQRQLDAFMRQAVIPGLPNPMQWANEMFSAFSPAPTVANDAEPSAPENVKPASGDSARTDDLDELRRQVSELTSRLDKLSSAKQAGQPGG